MAGVANVGTSADWTGSDFNQANWYAFGRLAWNPTLGADAIAREWVRQTLSPRSDVVDPVAAMMRASREAVVNYMTPLGLSHVMAAHHHYGPGPWADVERRDQSPTYFHRADAAGLGFDRPRRGSDAVSQYFPPLRSRYADRATVPDSLLLWFHHVGWGERLRTGRTLWDELALRYQAGVDTVRAMRRTWAGLDGRIDADRFQRVSNLLAIQEAEARWWRDASLQYFRQFARRPLPAGVEPPAHPLDFYTSLRCPADRTRPRCPEIERDAPSPRPHDP
jgi:alpha-glucuronidase